MTIMPLRVLPFILFPLLVLVILYWSLVPQYLTIGKEKTPKVEKKTDSFITNFIQQKTGVSVPSYMLVTSDKPFANMTQVFLGLPTLSISTRLTDTFTQEELSYVLLHETGHYVEKHSIKEIIVILLFVLGGWALIYGLGLHLSRTHLFWATLFIALIGGILIIQIQRIFEYEADYYALEKIDSPQSMITATEKFKAEWKGPSDTSILRVLFYRGVPYDQRIKMAQDKLQKENN